MVKKTQIKKVELVTIVHSNGQEKKIDKVKADKLLKSPSWTLVKVKAVKVKPDIETKVE